MNAKKTKVMFYNVPPQKIETIEGQQIEQALVGSTGEQDFKYLGSWIDSKDRDISVRSLQLCKHSTSLETSGRVIWTHP